MPLTNRWTPLVEREYDPNPSRDGIDFVLTPQERDRARLFALQLERSRRQANRRDESRELGAAGTVA